MPVQLDILENGHVLRYNLSDPWTYEDYEPILERDIAHRESVDHKVHNLTIAKIRTVPTGALRARSNPAFNHRTAGHLLMIGAPHVVRMFTEAVLKLTHFERIKFFDSEEEGMAFLRHVIESEDQTAKK
jgi:hypothetical protein